MLYKIYHSDILIDEAKNKQGLYFKWEDIVRKYRGNGLFDWSSGFFVALQDHTEIMVYNKYKKIPKYNKNEWKV